MKYKNILLGLLASLIFTSCEDIPTREFFPHSTPIIESASITPTSFIYGDSIEFKVKVSDPSTPLSTLELTMVANDKIISKQTFRTKGQNAEIISKISTKFLSELSNDANVDVQLKLINVEGDVTTGTISNIVGKRPYYSKLYMALEDGTIIPLTPNAAKSDKYQSAPLNLPNKIRYKIVEKITKDNQIDYTGTVWASVNGTIQVAGEQGDFITTAALQKLAIEGIIFDSYLFSVTPLGEDLPKISSLSLSSLDVNKMYGGEAFKEGVFFLEKNQNITITDAALKEALFNMDYFNRIDASTVQFLGETAPYILDYNASRGYVLVQEAVPAYPNILLVTGEGLGYPSTLKPEATSSWGFDQPMQFIAFRKIANEVYQGTVYFDASKANFKPFENGGWGNEKKSDDYTLPSIIINSAENKVSKPDAPLDGNWRASKTAVSGNYRITIDLLTKTVTAVPVTLP